MRSKSSDDHSVAPDIDRFHSAEPAEAKHGKEAIQRRPPPIGGIVIAFISFQELHSATIHRRIEQGLQDQLLVAELRDALQCQEGVAQVVEDAEKKNHVKASMLLNRKGEEVVP